MNLHWSPGDIAIIFNCIYAGLLSPVAKTCICAGPLLPVLRHYLIFTLFHCNCNCYNNFSTLIHYYHLLVCKKNKSHFSSLPVVVTLNCFSIGVLVVTLTCFCKGAGVVTLTCFYKRCLSCHFNLFLQRCLRCHFNLFLRWCLSYHFNLFLQ